MTLSIISVTQRLGGILSEGYLCFNCPFSSLSGMQAQHWKVKWLIYNQHVDCKTNKRFRAYSAFSNLDIGCFKRYF